MINLKPLSHLCVESAVFISDLHLSTEHPVLLKAFQLFCKDLITNTLPLSHNNHYKNTALVKPCLIILGDLFEGYCGDDDRSPYIIDVETSLADLKHHGFNIAFMHGNRDFLIAQAFLKRTGVVLLNDPCVLVLNDYRILMSHGDSWCTLDTEYQAFKLHSRSLYWQTQFLNQPLQVRQKQVQAYRQQADNTMRHHVYNNDNPIMFDVVDNQVIDAALDYHCNDIVHGHTHRPNQRVLNTDKKIFTMVKTVLGDWRDNPTHTIIDNAYTHGMMYATINQDTIECSDLNQKIALLCYNFKC